MEVPQFPEICEIQYFPASWELTIGRTGPGFIVLELPALVPLRHNDVIVDLTMDQAEVWGPKFAILTDRLEELAYFPR